MNRLTLLWFILILSAIVASLHFVALELYLYWAISWFDMLVHFGGGMLVALLGIWVIFFSNYFFHDVHFLPRNILHVALATAVIIGIGWELFEFVTGLHDTRNYAFDTATDLVMDVIGALGAYFFIVHSKWRVKLP